MGEIREYWNECKEGLGEKITEKMWGTGKIVLISAGVFQKGQGAGGSDPVSTMGLLFH